MLKEITQNVIKFHLHFLETLDLGRHHQKVVDVLELDFARHLQNFAYIFQEIIQADVASHQKRNKNLLESVEPDSLNVIQNDCPPFVDPLLFFVKYPF